MKVYELVDEDTPIRDMDSVELLDGRIRTVAHVGFSEDGKPEAYLIDLADDGIRFLDWPYIKREDIKAVVDRVYEDDDTWMRKEHPGIYEEWKQQEQSEEPR